MRSTRASNALDRLKRRSNNPHYSMIVSGNGLFCLSLSSDGGDSIRLCEPLGLEDFISFIDAYGPQVVKRVSKLDVEFSKQLAKKSPSS